MLMLTPAPNLVYVIGVPAGAMALSGLICVILFKLLGRVIKP